MSKLIDNNEIIKTIASFLDEETQYNLFSCNKKFSKYLLEKLMTNYGDFKLRYDLSTSTIKEQINLLQKKYEPDQFTAPRPEVTLSHGSEKAIKLLNEDKYSKIFKKELSPFLNEIINFDFSYKNIYEIKKLINGQEDKIKPSFYSRICGTTGLFVFLIKDILEYIGILQNFNKNVPSIMLNYLKYIGELQNKIEFYINNIKKINQKKKI